MVPKNPDEDQALLEAASSFLFGRKLTNALDDIGIELLPQEVLECVLDKAENLLNDASAIRVCSGCQWKSQN